MRLKSEIASIGLIGLLAVLLVYCANPVTPEGGPKDTKPPVFLKSTPPIYSRNFSGEKIRLWFDEFVELKDVAKELIISPPMNELPVNRIKGKSVIIEFKEPFLDSTTYTLFFGNAIVDITENNPLKNFRFAFSTGNVLDSLSLLGKVMDAFDNTPVDGVNIMLYLDNNDTIRYDSLPYFVKPYFLTKSDENGEFEFGNLPDKSFKLFALEDVNNSLTFDQPSERIAFPDSLIHPYYIVPPPPDTVLQDSLKNKEPVITEEGHPLLNLNLFQETDSVQRLIKATLEQERELIFVFKVPVIKPEIRTLNIAEPENWEITERGVNGDTLIYWIKSIPKDSLTFEVSDNGTILDTVKVALLKEVKRRREKKKDEEEQKKESLKVTTNGTPDLNKPYLLKFAYPLSDFDKAGILMIENEDTLYSPDFEFTDSVRRKITLNFPWKEGTPYKFIFPDSTFTDIRGLSQDTITQSFNTKMIADYGNFYLTLEVADSSINHIVQLFRGEKIVAQWQVLDSGPLKFEYLTPDTYKVKLIFDANKNGKWDSGDYHYRIQPEQVAFFEKEITVRANWDISESWDLQAEPGD